LQLELLLEEVIEKYSGDAENKGLKIKLDFDPPPPVLGDKKLVKQVISNLVGNGIKYTLEGEIKITFSDDGELVSFIVEDTGVGIPEDEIDRLGERFFKASTALAAGTVGSGLGLAITREIITKHGGMLRVESTIDKGSRFTALLPVMDRKRTGTPRE
jgi:signal transduction histidine kinase